jgi:hypothetical protein
MTLYVFGDSYAKYCANTSWAWYNLLSQSLDTLLVNFGFSGSGLEFTYHYFEKVRSQIKDNDKIVICITALQRRYFWQSKPHITNSAQLNHGKRKQLSQEEETALKMYNIYLENEDNYCNNLINFLYNLDHLCLDKSVQIQLLACFDHEADFLTTNASRFGKLKFSLGSLTTCSASEFNPELSRAVRLHFFGVTEYRANHLCKPNHIILADKIFRSFMNDEYVDLTYGFHRDIITTENLQNDTWRSNMFARLKDIEDWPDFMCINKQ